MDEDLGLVERFQLGDISAFNTLVSKYQTRIYDVVYSHTHNIEDAYDLSQEVFLRAFKSLGKFKKRSSFYTWLYRIAINACIDFTRQNSRITTIPIEEWSAVLEPRNLGNPNHENSPARAVEIQELRQLITKAINQLPPKQRVVFIMKRYQGLSLEEIAKLLDRSVGTVKAHLSHATSKLSCLLGPYLE